jgi:hypothetical protein
MNETMTSINDLLDRGKNGFSGFSYKQIKNSAERAAKEFGCEWAKKYPVSQDAINLRNRLRAIVLSNIPLGHSNKDVVWQRFRQYALNYRPKADGCKA